MELKEIDEMYMRRCLQLAKNGMLLAKPNPMVGAVIVSDDGRIIGEGYHICYGKEHAEVNAFASVRKKDEHLLSKSTIYVNLEPCSHFGKTPPCADLIIKKGVGRVVCGCIDPFSVVSGRGIQRIREAGIPVSVGVLERECLALNKRFITFNTKKRPYIILKWAQTANGFIGIKGDVLKISTSFTKMLVHKLRAENDAIIVGRNTEMLEHPQLNVRKWWGKSPLKVVLSSTLPEAIHDIPTLLNELYRRKCQSVIIEGGAMTLENFIKNDLYDEIRVEESSLTIKEGIKAPQLPTDIRVVKKEYFDNVITTYKR